MFVFRLGTIFLVVVMLLPTGPASRDRREARADHFCGRYPKTCAASGELLEAFQQKLSYGIVLARQALDGPSGSGYLPREAAEEQRKQSSELGSRFGEWQSAGRHARGSYSSHALAPNERSAEFAPAKR